MCFLPDFLNRGVIFDALLTFAMFLSVISPRLDISLRQRSLTSRGRNSISSSCVESWRITAARQMFARLEAVLIVATFPALVLVM